MKYKAVKRPPRRRVPDSALRLVAGVFLATLPFVMSTVGFEKFRVPKDVYSALFILTLGALFLISRQLRPRFRPRSWEFLLGIGIGYAGVHSIFSARPEVGFSGFFQIVYFSAFLLVLSEIATEGFQKKIWLWIAAGGAVNSVLTILEYFGKLPLMVKPTGEILEGRLNPAGLISDVNTGGVFFGLICLILLYTILAERDTKLKLLGVALFFANVAGLAFTRTLTAILALGFCLFLWLIFHHWWIFRTQKRMARSLIALWITLAVGLTAAGAAMTRSGVRKRVELVWSQLQEGNWSEVTAGRQPVYVITWDMIKQQPWLGDGLNTFGLNFFFHRAGTTVGQSVTMIDQPGSFREAHNEYLQIWEELGILGLLLFVVLLFGPSVRSAPLLFRTKDPQTFYWIGILSIAVLFIAISCLSFFPFHVSLTTVYAVLLIAGLRHFQQQEKTPRDEGMKSALWKIVGFSALAVWLGHAQVQKWRANKEMGFAVFLLENAVAQDYTPSQKMIIANTALQKLDKAEELHSRFYEIYNLKGSAYMILGRPQEAFVNYRKAANYLPSPEVFTNLAAAHIGLNQPDQARALLERALRYNPGYPRAHQALNYLKNTNHTP